MPSTNAAGHWQDSNSARSEEKNRREELWKDEMTFPLDYVPNENTLELFKNWAFHIGDKTILELMKKNVNSRDELENMILDRIKQAFSKAVQAFTYKCILMVWFPTPNVCLHGMYHQVFEKYKNKTDLRYVDIGCCMGTDLRYVCCNEKDKVKVENVLGIDIQEEFFDIGCNLLFNDSTTIRKRFIKANILEDQFLKNSSEPALLSSFIKSGTHSGIAKEVIEEDIQTENGTDIVYCALVFHLLSEIQTHQLSSLVYNNFLKDSGGIFFGSTVGSADPVEPVRNNEKRDIFGFSFVHSTQSLKEMLEGIGFVNVKVSLTNVFTASDIIRKDANKEGKSNSDIKQSIPNRGQISWYAEK